MGWRTNICPAQVKCDLHMRWKKKKEEEKWLNNNISSVLWNTKLVPYGYWPFQRSFSKKCVTSNALACKISLLLGWHEAYITDYQLHIAAPGTKTNKLAKTDETASMLVFILDKPVQNRVRVRVNLFCTNLHGTYSSRISMLGTVPDIQSMYALQNNQQYQEPNSFLVMKIDNLESTNKVDKRGKPTRLLSNVAPFQNCVQSAKYWVTEPVAVFLKTSPLRWLAETKHNAALCHQVFLQQLLVPSL